MSFLEKPGDLEEGQQVTCSWCTLSKIGYGLSNYHVAMCTQEGEMMNQVRLNSCERHNIYAEQSKA